MPETHLYYWKSQKITDFGHIAIKICNLSDRNIYPNGNAYISFWPIKHKNICCRPFGIRGKLVTEDSEVGHIGHPTIDLDLTPLELDLEAMLKERNVLTEYVDQSLWWLFAECAPNYLFRKKSVETCCTAITRVLRAGGIEKYLPLNAKFGSIKHFLLLSSTSIFISTSIFTAGLYAVVDDFEKQDDKKETGIFLAAIAGLIANGITVLLLEKTFEKKKLVEMSWPDGVIGISAAVGFALPFFIERRFISDTILYDATCVEWPIDVGILLSTIVGSFSFGFLANVILFLCSQRGHINTPFNIYTELKKITETNQVINKDVKQLLYKKHISFIAVILSGYTIADIVRRSGFFSNQWLFTEIIGCITVGYGFLKIFFIRHWDKAIDRECQRAGEPAATIIQAHNRSVGRHTFINTTTLLGMLLTVMIYNEYTNLLAPLKLVLSFPGSAVGYTVGMAPFMIYGAVKRCRSRHVNTAPNVLDRNREEIPLLNHESNQYQTSWLFILSFAALSGAALLILQDQTCSSHPAMKWISAIEGVILGFVLAYGLDKKLELTRCCQALFCKSTSPEGQCTPAVTATALQAPI